MHIRSGERHVVSVSFTYRIRILPENLGRTTRVHKQTPPPLGLLTSLIKDFKNTLKRNFRAILLRAGKL